MSILKHTPAYASKGRMVKADSPKSSGIAVNKAAKKVGEKIHNKNLQIALIMKELLL